MVSTYTQVSNIRLIYNDECMTAKYFKSRIMLCDYSTAATVCVCSVAHGINQEIERVHDLSFFCARSWVIVGTGFPNFFRFPKACLAALLRTS